MPLNSRSQFEARDGGCGTSALEVFGFLAFGLYLLNLTMNLGRRRRAADSSCTERSRPQSAEQRNAIYIMLRGFLNAQHARGIEIKYIT